MHFPHKAFITLCSCEWHVKYQYGLLQKSFRLPLFKSQDLIFFLRQWIGGQLSANKVSERQRQIQFYTHHFSLSTLCPHIIRLCSVIPPADGISPWCLTVPGHADYFSFANDTLHNFSILTTLCMNLHVFRQVSIYGSERDVKLEWNCVDLV